MLKIRNLAAYNMSISTNMDNNEILTVEQVVERLKCSDRYVREAITEGELKAYKRGHRYYVLYGDLVTFITSGKEGSKVKESDKSENEE